MDQDHLILPTSSFERWMITISVMLATVIEVLDITIVNVSLPHMMGSLTANTEQISWVLTSYIVSAAIFMPLTGFLVARLGQKRLLLFNIVGFCITSMLCGASQSIFQIVLFRTLQGIFGASLMPLSQLIITQTFPESERGLGMAVWGIGVMSGPVLGPTIGGYITEALNWRWIFYFNGPICIIAFFMALRFVKESPRRFIKIDWPGLILMATGIGCLQLFLDQGNQNDWFESTAISWLAITCVVCLTLFIARGLHVKNNIINLKLFKDYNFTSCTIMLALYMAGFFSVLSLQPILLETVLNYPTTTAGLVMAPRGIASAISMLVAAKFYKYIDVRYLIGAGSILAFAGAYWTSTFNLDVNTQKIVYSSLLQGFGIGLFFGPISVISISSLKKTDIPEGTGLFNFGRSIGSSIGISIVNTILTRSTQISWNELSGHINESNQNFFMWMNHQNLDINQPNIMQIVAHQIFNHASMIAFVSVFHLIAISYIIIFLLTPFLKPLAAIPDSTSTATHI